MFKMIFWYYWLSIPTRCSIRANCIVKPTRRSKSEAPHSCCQIESKLIKTGKEKQINQIRPEPYLVSITPNELYNAFD